MIIHNYFYNTVQRKIFAGCKHYQNRELRLYSDGTCFGVPAWLRNVFIEPDELFVNASIAV